MADTSAPRIDSESAGRDQFDGRLVAALAHNA